MAPDENKYSIDHGLRTPREKIAFTARPEIQSQSQIFRYGQCIFCLPHRPNFSDIFDLCLHWVSVVRGQIHTIGKFSGTFERSYLFYSQCSCHIHNELENLHKNRIQNSMDWHQDYTGLVCHLATGIFFRNVHLVSILL